MANHNLKARKCKLGKLVRCDVSKGSLAKTTAISAVVIILEWGHSPAALHGLGLSVCEINHDIQRIKGHQLLRIFNQTH